MSKFLLFEIDDGIATLTMNRPEKLNAFTSEMLTGLISALDECESRDDVRAAINQIRRVANLHLNPVARAHPGGEILSPGGGGAENL